MQFLSHLKTRATLNRVFVLAFMSVACLMCGFTASAQIEQARIAGQVLDSNNAVVPNATITITNVGTNETRTIVSGDDGAYSVTSLRPATYTISVSAAGFAANTITDVQLAVGQQLDLPILLAPQGGTVTVEVTSASDAGIDTSSARLGASVSPREVQNLPLNGRQLSQLYLQAPGTVNTGTGTYGDIRFSGRAVQQNAIRYDGVEATAIIDSSPGNINGEVASPFRLQASLENIQEFRADSNNYPAEFGTGTGGQISVITKAGTNRFTGSLFEYFRNEKLDARNFFDNAAAGIPKGILRLNQFGGSVGGPIVKNKLFFFGSYEGYRVRAGINNVETAPYLSLGNAGSVLPTAANPQGLPGMGGTAVSSVVRPFIAGFRSPNSVAVGFSGTPGLELVQFQGVETTNEDAFFGRIDYSFNERNTFYARYQRDKGIDFTPEGVSGRVTRIQAVPDNGAFGFQSVITNSIVNDFRFGINRAATSVDAAAPIVNGIDYSNFALSIGGNVAIQNSSTIAGQGANVGVSSPGGLVRANSATNGRGQPYFPYSLSFIDSLNYTTGNHNIKVGGEIRLLSLRTDRLGGTTYTFASLNNFLTGTLQSTQFNGDLSAPSPFTGVSGQKTGREQFYIGYAQDTWRIRQNLTLSYGLRYEYYTPLKERNDAQVLFNIRTGQLDPATNAAYRTSKKNFGPRVALTYSPLYNSTGFFGGSRTVFRGGFGIYYGPGQVEDQIQPIESDRIGSTINGGNFSGNNAADVASIINNFTANPLNRSYQPRAYAPEYNVPERVYQYSGSYQQELPYKLVSTVAYVGSKGRNLFLRSVSNQILPGSARINNGAALPTGVGIINRVDNTNPASESFGRVVGTTTVRQFAIVSGTTVLNPFAEIDYKTSGGRDSYNALQTTLARRFDNGLTLNSQYTFSSSRGNTSGSNDARTSAQLDNFDADFGRNNFDVRHSFNVSALFKAPIGKGKLVDLGSVGNYFLGGLEIGGIVNARSGLPIEVLIQRNDVVIQCQQAGGCPVVTAVNQFSTTTTLVPNGFTANLPGAIGNGQGVTSFNAPALPQGFVAVINTPGGGASRNVRRPDLISGVPLYLNGSGADSRNIINPAAFATPAAGSFGNLERNALRGPIFRQFDLILSQRFNVTERANLQFRAEFFNLLNTTNFANPAATLGNALPTLTVVNPAAVVPGTTMGNQLTSSTFVVNPTSSAFIQPGQAYTTTTAGGSFGQIRSTVGRTVGLGNSRQIQFALRLSF
ncbi:MAG: TonB-dependent receptor [Pyrinomonadaceae bacterium]|nr:TonB-dependent receptor [Pyrinomonadaceae bacterium]